MIGEVIKGDFRDRCLFRALGMLEDRGRYWADQKDYERCGCYDSAADILRYAINEDWEALNQFDYYDDEDITKEWVCTPEEVNKVCEV